MTLLHWAILAPFILAIFVPILYKSIRTIHTGWFVLILPITIFSYLLQFLSTTSSGKQIEETVSWIPSLGINFTVYVDGLSLLFALLITGIGSLVVLYSIFYLSKQKEALGNFYVYLLMFMGAMLGVVLSDNIIVLYVFWELTSLSSFLLISYWYEKERSRYGALKSMLITMMGGFSMLAGFVLMFLMTNTFSIREIIIASSEIVGHAFFLPAMLLILLGAFTKSAQFPFHIWLPDAMEAPTPVSAYLHSATMVKAGLYLVARFTPVFAPQAEWIWLVAGFGIFTLFWGAFNAVKQTDLKGILAFSTVSQLGLIMSLLGVGAASLHFDFLDDNLYVVATVAAIFHLINHATFKGSLFMVVGIVDHETGTRDIRKLGGLMALMPITFTVALIGSLSMAGLPPFNGFLSKEMFFTGMLSIANFDLFNFETLGILFPIIAWLASIFTFIYSFKLVFKTFTGRYQPEQLEKKPHEAPIGMLISPIILGALVIIIGFAPNILSQSLIEPAVVAILPSLFVGGHEAFVHIEHWHGFSTELLMTIGVVLLGFALYYTSNKWQGVYDKLPQKLTLNRLYDRSLTSLEKGSQGVTNVYMTGFIRDYLVYIFSFLVLILIGSMIAKNAFAFDSSALAPIGIYEVILALVMLIASLVVVFARTRLMAIISLGSIGITLALFFVIFRAPDLALTQIVIETVSTALFLLCFYHLPKLKKELSRIPFKMTNAVIAIGVGTTVTLLGIVTTSTRLFESISEYFVRASHDLAGGNNMVNVILVDFRGFDTMFEILVLSIAGLSIIAMIKLRLSGREE